ncbi:MAG TPA: G1 family glutamic endopeptidase [Thermoleophilaceae bacterium]|nr:G1 family glutamic endopeptidase [Thermoleophilaceae bacterium]
MPKPTICFACLLVAAALLVPVASAQAATAVSSNWAGYVATPKTSGTKFKTASGTWVVPQGDCSSLTPGYSATWVGIGGYRSSSKALEQTGTEFDCSLGTAKYSAWYELVPDVGHDINMTVNPGDTIDAAVSVKGNRVTLYLRNRTSGAVFRKAFTMSAPDRTSAEWIIEAPSSCDSAVQCSQLPLSNFGTQSFTRASVTSARGTRGSVSYPGWSNTKVTLSQGGEHGGFAQFASERGAEPSALSADGASFSVSYTEQAPPTQAPPPMFAPGAGGLPQ